MKHGSCRKGLVTRTYKLWNSMNRRCHTPSASGYVKYGAKGVTVCDEWRKSYETFLKDMGEIPDGLTLDRIDNSKGYSKENCRYITNKQQARNKTTNKLFTINGVTKSLIEWVELKGAVSYGTINCRLKRGWDIEDALSLPQDFTTQFQRDPELKFTRNGVTKPLMEWVETDSEYNYSTVVSRIMRGRDIESALKDPLSNRGRGKNRSQTLFTISGVSKSLIDWVATESVLNYQTVSTRISRGWTIEKALKIPPGKRGWGSRPRKYCSEEIKKDKLEQVGE